MYVPGDKIRLCERGAERAPPTKSFTVSLKYFRYIHHLGATRGAPRETTRVEKVKQGGRGFLGISPKRCAALARAVGRVRWQTPRLRGQRSQTTAPPRRDLKALSTAAHTNIQASSPLPTPTARAWALALAYPEIRKWRCSAQHLACAARGRGAAQ